MQPSQPARLISILPKRKTFVARASGITCFRAVAELLIPFPLLDLNHFSTTLIWIATEVNRILGTVKVTFFWAFWLDDLANFHCVRIVGNLFGQRASDRPLLSLARLEPLVVGGFERIHDVEAGDSWLGGEPSRANICKCKK